MYYCIVPDVLDLLINRRISFQYDLESHDLKVLTRPFTFQKWIIWRIFFRVIYFISLSFIFNMIIYSLYLREIL